MAYIFDPERNTFIDDEDKSFGNKFALNDVSEELIKKIELEQGPGTLFPASELPVPENPYKDFEDRNPMAGIEDETREYYLKYLEDRPEGSKGKPIPLKTFAPEFIKENAADGGLMRQNFVVPGLVFAPQAIAAMAAITGLGIEAVRRYAQANPDLATNLLENFKTNSANLKDNVLAFVDGVHGEKSEETKKIEEAGRVETFPIQEDYSASFGGKGTEIPEQTKQEPPVSGGMIDFGLTTGGQKIPETKKEDFIMFNKKQDSPKKRGQKKIEKLNPDTVTEIKNIINDYRTQKTNLGKTQPTMTMGDKTELLNLVLNKFKEKENRVPIYSEVVGLMPQISNLHEIIKYGQIELPKGKADFDRTDPDYVELMNNKFQTKAIEQNTITNFKEKSFFPKTVTLKNGDVVNAKDFFEKNLAEKINYGPGRKGNPALQNKELANLFNTNERKIEETNKRIKNNPDFEADYPPPRAKNYASIEAAKTLKDAREYAKSLPNGDLHVKNVLIQESKRIPDLNNLFKNGTLKITDYPKIIEDLNTTMDRETGIQDTTITKTEKEMTERAMRDKGLFQVFHNVPKSSKDKQIEFLSNRYISLYKTNAGFVKSAEAYIKNQKDKPDYKERVEDFDNYLKERGLRIKIDNKFYGIDFQEMINSNTGEFTGMNRTLEYYGLPKFENGTPLKKVKKADGGSIKLSPMPRVDFNGGGAVGADDNFATELEYFLLNEDAELPKADSYRETMNPVTLVNDMIDPRNYAYYADRLAETGIRIGEFGARVLPALGQLTADLVQRPAFKVTGGTGQGYVQDYTDVMPSNIKGTGIFSEFLDNLVGAEGTKVITEKTGLKSLIESEEQKQKDRRSTIGPKVLADQVTLGAELTAPIFPGLKLLKAYAKNRKLPVDNTTKEVMEKEIDEVLSTQNITRRDFLKATGAGGAVIIAKMLGFGDELATTTKVVEKATKETAAGGVPPYFLNLVKKIKTMGDDVTQTQSLAERQIVTNYKDYTLTEDIMTGEQTIQRYKVLDDDSASYYGQPLTEEAYMNYRPGVADETTKGKVPPGEYEEGTALIRSDREFAGDVVDESADISDDIIEEGTMFEDNIAEFGK